MPERVQRRRTRGWRMPKGTVYVGRGSKWGNPYRVGDRAGDHPLEYALAAYREWVMQRLRENPKFLVPLRGKDLACWCRVADEEGNQVGCHADILLDLANKANHT